MRRAVIGAFAGLLLTAGSASAQQSGGHATEPGQIEKRIRTPDEPSRRMDEVAPPKPAAGAAVAAPEGAFTLVGADIVGSTVYPIEELTFAYEEFLGRTISVAEIETILDRITGKYRADGYVLSRATAPAQDAAFGVLRVEIVEGFVERVAFSGVAPGIAAAFAGQAGKIEAMRPLRLAGLERRLLLMADAPGMRVFPSLVPIDEERGAWRLDIRLEHRRVEGFVNFDNRGTTPVGPVQAYAGASLNTVMGGPARTRLTVFTIPPTPEELRYIELFHEHQIGSDGLRVFGSASRSVVDTGDAGTTGKENSHGTRVSLGLTWPFLRSRDANVSATLKFDAIESDKNSANDVFDDRLRVLRLGGFAHVTDDMGGSSWLNAEISKGFDFLHATDRNATLVSRPGGRSDFVKLKIDAARTQALVEHWSANLAASAQKSPHTLLSAEEFTVGGRQFGRAYNPSDISGQDGAAAALELRFDPPLDIDVLKKVQLYGFYDIGAVWGRGVTRASMASAGGGLRLELPFNISAELELATPLTRPISPGESEDHGPRAFFNLLARF